MITSHSNGISRFAIILASIQKGFPILLRFNFPEIKFSLRFQYNQKQPCVHPLMRNSHVGTVKTYTSRVGVARVWMDFQ